MCLSKKILSKSNIKESSLIFQAFIIISFVSSNATKFQWNARNYNDQPLSNLSQQTYEH